MKKKSNRLTSSLSRAEAAIFIAVALVLVASLTALLFKNQANDLFEQNPQQSLSPETVVQLEE